MKTITALFVTALFALVATGAATHASISPLDASNQAKSTDFVKLAVKEVDSKQKIKGFRDPDEKAKMTKTKKKKQSQKKKKN